MSGQTKEMREASVRPKVRSKGTNEEPLGEPTNSRSIRFFDRDGAQRCCSALNVRFSTPMTFVKYAAPPASIVDTSVDRNNHKDINGWLENVKAFELNLRDLLLLPHHKFWATIINEKSVHLMLESYLKNAPRFYDFHSLMVTDRMRRAVNLIHKLVFKVFLRMSTVKESKKDYMTTDGFGQMLYKHYIFDIPKLMDMCVVFGHQNEQLKQMLRTMIETVFSSNGNYYHDLVITARGIVSDFERIMCVLGVDESSLTFEGTHGSRLATIKWPLLVEVIRHLTSLSVTIFSFVSLFPASAKAFHEESVDSKLVNFYESVFPLLSNELEKRFRDSELQFISDAVKTQVVTSRSVLVLAFRDIIVHSLIDPLMNGNVDMEMKERLNLSFLEVMSQAVSEKSFIVDYSLKFPFESDLQLLLENSQLTGFNRVDQSNIDYVLSVTGTLGHQHNGGDRLGEERQLQGAFKLTNGSVSALLLNPSGLNNGNAASILCASSYTATGGIGEVELASLITSVKDLFPDLGDGYIEACLSHFGFDSEKVVNALLCQELPDSITNMDQSLPRKHSELRTEPPPPPPSPRSSPIPQVIAERKNICDGDEFDFYRNKEVDLSKIHKGKKTREVTSKQALDPETKEAILRLDVLQVMEEEYRLNQLEYNDEYDDTYLG